MTHPSEPNYVAAVGGDFWGVGDDNLYHIPPKRVIFLFFYPSPDRPRSISTIVDLLEEKSISWAEYQENMPTDGYEGFK